MTKINWGGPGSRIFEAGIDRGVLYIGSEPGVPWIGLIQVTKNQSGGETKPRYLDGVKISNRASLEEFEGTVEAYTYPTQFEKCDGTIRFDNGLQVTQQKRAAFGMSYRSKIGNEQNGLDLAYKIHILYNLRAEPSQRGYKTLTDQSEPATFNWKVTSRSLPVSGFRPSSHFVIDSREVPNELLTDIEELLYGTEDTDPTLPSPAELVFLFDSYLDTIYDAGTPYTPVFVTYDAGDPYTTVLETIDGGAL